LGGDGSAVVKLTDGVLPSERVVNEIDGIIRRSGLWTSRWLHSTVRNVEKDAIGLRARAFTVCRNVPGILAAGGCVSRMMDFSKSKIVPRSIGDRACDLDLYIRTADVSRAHGIVDALMRSTVPYGNVTMTEFALTFEVWHDDFVRTMLSDVDWIRPLRDSHGNVVYKVQLIFRVVPDTGDLRADLGCLFGDYDLLCCMFATDGRDVYATGDAVESMYVTRVSHVDWSRVTSAHRMAKYHMWGGFDFEILGPDGVRLNVHRDSAGMHEISEEMHIDLENMMHIESQWYDAEYRYDALSLSNDMYYGLDSKRRLVLCGYDNTTKILVGCDGNMLTASFEMFMDVCASHVGGDGKFVTCAMSSGAYDDVANMVRTGSCPESYVIDWKCTTMNAFCDGLLSRVPSLSQEEYDGKISDFADGLDRFVGLVRGGVGRPFQNGHAGIFRPNVDFEKFRQHWCVSRLETEPSPPKKAKLDIVPGPRTNCPSDDASPPFEIVGSHPVSTFCRIWIPKFRNSHGSWRRLEITIPPMLIEYGLPIMHPSEDEEFVTSMRCMCDARMGSDMVGCICFLGSVFEECRRCVLGHVDGYGLKFCGKEILFSDDLKGPTMVGGPKPYEIVISIKKSRIVHGVSTIGVVDPSGRLVPYDIEKGYHPKGPCICTVRGRIRLDWLMCIFTRTTCMVDARWSASQVIVEKI
jgi:hypothetical protein